MNIAIATDHAGYEFKKELAEKLKSDDHQVMDFGTFSAESVDYPDFAFPAAEAVAAGIADCGIIFCGSGIGMSIVCNKVTGVRSANCCSAEAASLARRHNNANVLNFGVRLSDKETIYEMIEAFLTTDFEGDRHMIRVEKIHSITGW